MDGVKHYFRVAKFVRAVRYEEQSDYEFKSFSPRIVSSPVLEPTKSNPSGRYLWVYTLEGKVLVAVPGDWVVKDDRGQLYVLTNTEFISEYSEVFNG